MSVALTESQISEWCVRRLAEMLHRPASQIQTDVNFFKLGIDSAMSIFLMVGLEELLDMELSPDHFIAYPTISTLAKYLTKARPGAPDSLA